MRLLLVDHHKMTARSLRSLYPDADVDVSIHASAAITKAANSTPDIVVVELSLAAHSGLEFLYEFRTYKDWQAVPVIIYSSIQLPDHIMRSRAWEQLGIARYLYKPQCSLRALRQTIDAFTVAS